MIRAFDAMGGVRAGKESPTGDEVLDEGGMTVSYEVPGYASIHYHPKVALSNLNKLRVFEKGLSVLALRLADMSDIKFIAATSWVVSTKEDFFTSRGFEILAKPYEADIQQLIEEYKKRRDETQPGMVWDQHKAIEPKVARREIAAFLNDPVPKRKRSA